MSRRAAFLDRDGVINVSPAPGAYVRRWEEFEFLRPVFDWVRLLNALNLLVIVVTNQRGVALGQVTLNELDEIHQRMCAEFGRRGCRIDDVLVCPHEAGACNCRKPRPGLVLAAQHKWDIDLAGSLLIGDSDRDRDLADACGLRFLRCGHGRILL